MNTIKKQQLKTLAIIGGVLVVGVLLLYYTFQSNNPPVVNKTAPVKVDFATPLTAVSNEDDWREHGQNEIAAQQKMTNALHQQISLLDARKQQEDQTLATLQQEVSDLNKKVQTTQNTTAAMDDHTLSLTKVVSDTPIIPVKNPRTYVPAGTFVRAVTIGGADASAGVTSQGNPSPMEYRILDQGTLPNHFHSKLKGCFVTAAAIGDISSERGEVRTERLSCVKADGTMLDVPIKATVFGPDGKNGVRGMPVWREGALLQRAFAAGLLSGISNGISQSYTTSNLTPLGAVNQIDNHKILQYGVASGVGNAADKLADYNIKRADMYHPVIQLSAGTIVDIVFLKGFYLKPKPIVDTTATANQVVTTTSATMPTSTPQPLPLSNAQIAALQQKNTAQGYED